jgi:alpha-tubulin suppressor-like RCC1 family protein
MGFAPYFVMATGCLWCNVMKRTLSPIALAFAGKLSTSPMLSIFRSILLGIALLGFVAPGCAQAGTVIAWGDDRHGQSDVPSGLSNVVAVSAGEWHSLALKADGTVVAWGANNSGQGSVPSGLSNIVIIAAAGFHNLAIKADSTVTAWGQNDYGQCNVPAGLSNVVAVSGGWTHSLALKSDGTVVAWGNNDQGQATVPFDLTTVVSISSGEYHNLALKADGTVTAWGWNGVDQCNVPSDLSNVAAIAASGLHSLALKTDGTVTAWGYNEVGQCDVPAGLSNVVTLAGGLEHNLALKSDGTVAGWGSDESWANSDCQYIGSPNCVRQPCGQIDIPVGLSNVVAVAAGDFHSLALRTDGQSSSPVPLFNPMRTGNTFSVSAKTQNGRVYELQWNDSLASTNWISFPLVPGTGAERVFSDPASVADQRFYRLRRW